MTRHILTVEIDLDDEDQTEEEFVREALSEWIAKGIEMDENVNQVRWPEDYRVKHETTRVVREKGKR